MDLALFMCINKQNMKKLYVKPEIEIVKLEHTSPLLEESGEYDDDFGMAISAQNTEHV